MTPLLKVVPVSKNFVGRKNILADIFSRIGKGPVIIGLYGNSGVGKTTLGGVLVNNLLKRFDEDPSILICVGRRPTHFRRMRS